MNKKYASQAFSVHITNLGQTLVDRIHNFEITLKAVVGIRGGHLPNGIDTVEVYIPHRWIPLRFFEVPVARLYIVGTSIVLASFVDMRYELRQEFCDSFDVFVNTHNAPIEKVVFLNGHNGLNYYEHFIKRWRSFV